MPYLNPYIQQAQENPRILCESEEYAEKRGKWNQEFENKNHLHLEIGTGLGNFFSRVSNEHSDINFIGLEIKYKRLVKTYEKTTKLGREDIFLIREYAEKIGEIFAPEELDQVYIYFPDPWPKKRHWKNRLIQKDFLDTLSTSLKSKGKVLFKTDDIPYFEWVVEHFTNHPSFQILVCNDDYEAEKDASHNNSTEFEMIWRTQGKKVMYLEIEKI